MQYFELMPAYGRDYKTKKEVIAAFNAEKDFEGDYTMNFKLVNRQQLLRPCIVNLRYSRLTRVAVLTLEQ